MLVLVDQEGGRVQRFREGFSAIPPMRELGRLWDRDREAARDGRAGELAAMTMAAQSKQPWSVFLGAAVALTAVSAIGVIVGSALGAYLPLAWIKRVAAAAFILIGILMLAGKF